MGARTADSAQRKFRILVVDGESSLRVAICTILERYGYDVVPAASSREAMDKLELSCFDLVLTEIVMKNGDGIALLDWVHAQLPLLPVVMVSAVQDITVVINVMQRGASDYLLKPFKRAHLLKTVLRALDHGKVLLENRSYQQNLEQAVRARTEMLRQANDDLEHSYDVMLEALGDALDLKDSDTEGHSKRVTAYTLALAKAMGINQDQIKAIARGAFLHDIGKMAIPDQILRKPGELTAEEQVVMREHCALGYQMLRKITFLREAAEMVLFHQEHYDGNGYPRGLRGDEIPIGARIFALADALDTITSDRPYRKARDYETARQEILRCSGAQFDPNIVEAFLAIPNELWQELRSEITGQHKRFSVLDAMDFSKQKSPF
jgi:putative nucleotidyltransferase with HDIG domain